MPAYSADGHFGRNCRADLQERLLLRGVTDPQA
jgi:hypothetical protein